METTILLEEIVALGNIPENLHSSFLRIANGLHQKAEYPKKRY